MHPFLIVVPVLGVAFGPRLWARAQMHRFDVQDGAFLPADELARRLLDRQGLALVRVEVTDLGDHYDPRAKAVRIDRAHFQRSSLTAATAAAHEVGHAMQDASGYWAFRLHHILARVAHVTTSVGTVLLLAVPAAAVAAKTPAPSRLLGLAAAGMLTSGLAAQLAALPSELDASMSRALPLLRDCCLSEAQERDARRILLACSFTYLASAAVPALALWPFVGPRLAWVGLRSPAAGGRLPSAGPGRQAATASRTPEPGGRPRHSDQHAAGRGRPSSPARSHSRQGATAGGNPGPQRRALLRAVARPLVRRWLLLTGDY
ncbi:MAG: hypothetical protein GVY09_09080 [Gammaproteobacteria bacterium]|jgi:Zn-dependent membrane protease YugP|nr:hypothetical protein [Gammaproteobacteria bacterium]